MGNATANLKLYALSISAWVIFVIVEGYRCFVEPLLAQLGLVAAGFGDATYSRKALPLSPKEKELI